MNRWPVWLGLMIVWGTAVLPTHPRLTTAAATTVEVESPTPLPPDIHYHFAVIGDYGDNSQRAERVADLVASWAPDFVITLGDNNYPNGEAATIDDNIGQHYGQYIGNYQGQYGSGSPINRFWPSLGNHDWLALECDNTTCSGPYFDYFILPGNERYYDVDYGLIHLFAVDGDFSEPDGNRVNSTQANWLQSVLMASTSCFKVIYFHNSPYSSGYHGSQLYMQWPFDEWGADVVLSGHDHDYERLDVAGLPYFVNGLGGGSITSFANQDNLPPGVTSWMRYNRDSGAMLVDVTAERMLLQFYNTEESLIDEYTIHKSCPTAPPATPTLPPTPWPSATAAPTLTPTPTPTAVPTGAPLATSPSTSTAAMVTAAAAVTATSPAAIPPQTEGTDARWLALVPAILLIGWLILRLTNPK